MALMMGLGLHDELIGRTCHVSRETVGLWRKKFHVKDM